MVFIKILQRKDAASVVIAIALGLALAQFISAVASDLSSVLSVVINNELSFKTPIYDWRTSLFNPAMLLALQVVVLELLLRIVTVFRRLVIKMKHKS